MGARGKEVTPLEKQAIRDASSRPKASSRITILLVEDDLLTGRTLAKALQFAGYRLRTAATGAETCALLASVRPNLIILDLMLPDIDGFALMMQLQQMTAAPIVICSAREGQIDRALARRLGAADFVGKPFDLDDLEGRIDAVLQKSRSRVLN